MSMRTRKKRLEAGLEDLFSTSKQQHSPDSSGSEPDEGEFTESDSEIDVEDQSVAARSAPSAAAEPAQRDAEPDGSVSPASRPLSSRQTGDEAITEAGPTPNGHVDHVVVFALATEYYAVDIFVVESILRMQPITEVPFTAPYVEGVTNLRGTVLPVLDLRKRFDLVVGDITGDTRIIVVELNDERVGLVVDRVTEVLQLPHEAIEPPSPMVMTVDSAFITGVAKVDERLVILIDLQTVLSIEE